MKKTMLSLFVFSALAVSPLFAHGNDVTLKGTLIDSACAGGHKDDLASFVKTHDKMCLLKGPCSKSGYSLYSDGKLYKIAEQSQLKVQDFLKKDDSKLDVIVMGDLDDDTIGVEDISNQNETSVTK